MAHAFQWADAPFVTHFTGNDFGAGPVNGDMAQDDKGVMYFANYEGVLLFDGHRWQVAAPLNRSIVRCVQKTTNGSVYAGAQGDLGVVKRMSDGQFVFESLAGQIPPEQRAFTDVWHIYETPEEVIFHCEQKLLLLHKMHQTARWTALPTGISNVSAMVGSNLYFWHPQQGIFSLDISGLQWKNTGVWAGREKIVNMLPSDVGNMLIVTENGMQRWTPGHTQVERDRRFDSTEPVVFAGHVHGHVIVVGYGNGVVRFWSENGAMVRQFRLAEGVLRCGFTDREGNFWSAAEAGLSYWAFASPFRLIGARHALPRIVSHVAKYKGRLFAATHRGVFYAKDSNSGSTASAFQRLDNIPAERVWRLDSISAGLFCSTHQGGYLYTPDGSVKPVSKKTGVYNCHQLADGLLLVGTYNGLAVVQEVNGVYRTILVQPIVNGGVRVVVQGTQVWVSNPTQLWRFTFSPDWKSVTSKMQCTAQQGLPGGAFMRPYRLGNRLFFLSDKGLYHFNEETSQFQGESFLRSHPGRYKDIIHMGATPEQNIWFLTHNVAGYMRRQFDDTYLLDESSVSRLPGPLVAGFEQILPISETESLVAAKEGIYQYTPVVHRNGLQRSTLLTRMRIGTRFFLPDSAAHTFAYSGNAIGFEFVCPNFNRTEPHQYQCFLEGFDPQWTDWHDGNERYYTNLPEGQYVFRVKSRGADLQHSTEASFAFTILPPWYRHPLARAAYALGLGWIVLLAVRFFLKRAQQQQQRRHNTEQQALLDQKHHAENEAENLRTENLRLEIEARNREMEQKEKELSNTTLLLVHKNELLSQLGDELKQLARYAPDDSARNRIRQINRLIDEDLEMDKTWEQFEVHFDQTHEQFLKRLKERYPQLKPSYIKLCAYLRLNLSSKEIAVLMNISVRGVEQSRVRLRRMLDIKTEENLVEVLMAI